MRDSVNQETVSFIIPHRGRIDFLKEVIESINAQVYDLNAINVYIVTQDDNCEVKAAINNGKIEIVILQENVGVSISGLRNRGAHHAKSKYLAFIDADIKLADNWVKEMVGGYEANAGIACLSGIQLSADNAGSVEQIRTNIAACSKPGIVDSLPGANLFMKRDLFLKTSGFPESLATCEDIFFTNSLTKYGKLLIIDTTSFIHLGEDKTFLQVLIKEFWRAKSNLKSLSNRRIPLKEYPSILLPFWFFFSIVILICSAFVRSSSFLYMAAGMYLLPVVVYSLRARKKNAKRVSFFKIIFFYFLYHTSRSFGTLSGLFQTIEK